MGSGQLELMYIIKWLFFVLRALISTSDGSADARYLMKKAVSEKILVDVGELRGLSKPTVSSWVSSVAIKSRAPRDPRGGVMLTAAGARTCVLLVPV